MSGYSRDDIIASLRAVAEATGVDVATMTKRHYEQNRSQGQPSERAIRRGLGSWSSARAHAAASRESCRDLPSIFEDDYGDEDTEVDAPAIQRHIVTYAQNATPVEGNFWSSLLVCCEHYGAQLHVIAGRYKNPTSIWTRKQEREDRWDERVTPYLVDGRVALAPDLVVYGDTSIQPTQVRPLSGFEVFAGQASAIFGHPKIQLMTVAGSPATGPRTFTTTGACTVENYTPSKAGRKAEAHHIYGACLVEVSPGGVWFVRQINATSDGEFDDLGWHFSPYGVEPAEPPAALVMGDVHCPNEDLDVVAVTFGPDGVVEELKPRCIILHDVLDFRSRNHHDLKDPDRAFEKWLDGEEDVRSELDTVVEFIDAAPVGPDVVVVASNHDEALDRWLREGDPSRDPVNARLFYELRAERLALRESEGEYIPALEMYYRRHGECRARFLRRDESLMVAGIECGFHGDRGVNGSRGSILQYAKMGHKAVVGHSHSPAVLDGVVSVGLTGKLDQGYNALPSNWAQAHALIYASGKRTLLFVKHGEWRAR